MDINGKKRNRYLIGIALLIFGLAVLIRGAWFMYERNPEAFFFAIGITVIVVAAIGALVFGLGMIFEED